MDPRPLTELAGIPAPPRDATFTATFGRRAAVGLLGVGLLLAALLVLAMQVAGGAGAPFEDWALDSERNVTTGKVVRVEPAPAGVQRLTFRYLVGDVEHESTSHARTGAPATDQRHAVEFLAREPSVSRLAGTTRAVPPRIPWRVTVLCASAGVLALLLWLRFGVAQRQLLRQGRLAPAQVVRVRAVPVVQPAQLAVDYTFRDAENRERTGRQWCPSRTTLGQRLLSGDRDVQVLHDERDPRRSALASSEHFEPVHGLR